jgi:ElaB/YqjD/DUF883 family membrane-anchored ribosome-binding protein
MTNTQANMERLGYDLKRMVRDLEELLEGIPEDLSDEARRTRKRLEGTLESVKGLSRRLEKAALVGVRATNEAVHDYPYPFIGVAVGIGLLLGALFCRKDIFSY